MSKLIADIPMEQVVAMELYLGYCRETLSRVAAKARARRPDCKVYIINCVMWNSDGSACPLRERFTVPAQYPAHLLQCKCIVRPAYIKSMAAHGPIQTDSHAPRLVNSRGQPIWSIFDPALTAEAAWVDHYFTRSLEEWREKIARGSCDPLSHREFNMFWEINPDMDKDTT